MTEKHNNHDKSIPEHETEAVGANDEPQTETEAANAFREFVHHQRIAFEELGRAIDSLLPKDFKEHTSNAGRAFVDSFRSLVDAARDEFSTNAGAATSNDEPDRSTTGSTKIKVEID